MLSEAVIKKSIPNFLTGIRFVFAIGIIIAFFFDSSHWTLCLFVCGAFTDPFDGYLARRWKVVSNWGKKWDPLADKSLTWISYILLTLSGIHYIFVIFFATFWLRELITNRLKSQLEKGKGIIVPANKAAKQKTIYQMIMLGWLWLTLLLGNSMINDYLVGIAFVFGLIAFGLAYYSGYEYAKLYREHYRYQDIFKKVRKS
jgi:CDP-diacylglycerol--glycerol-3-phosphate 3-phosphatidyltransferase